MRRTEVTIAITHPETISSEEMTEEMRDVMQGCPYEWEIVEKE